MAPHGSAAGSAPASGGTTKFPHAGKPLPGGKIKPAPWWSGLGQKWTETTAGVQTNWANTTKRWYKHGKFQMPVDVQVDVLRPMWVSIQESSDAVWRRLPPPVQQAAPYLGAASLTALVVHRIGAGKLQAERERNQRLRGRVDLLLSENEELHMKIADLKARAQGPRSPSELSMARALAEATQAAAAAATAAASAATACARPPGQQLVPAADSR